jgi:RNA-directed DNA polymerase
LNSSKHIFLEYYRDHGLPDEVAERYSAYASNLRDQGLPVIFEVGHLSVRLGLTSCFIAKAINAPEAFYREFSLKKKLGGTRRILAPYPSMYQAQSWIKKRILDQLPVSKAANAYVKGSSIIDNARNHVNKRSILTIDLSDFFGTIKKKWIIRIFRELGYSPQVSFYLSSICCHSDCLPQGAPTSPPLSNIVCRLLDARLLGLSQSANLSYTRYADDLAFSGDYIPARFLKAVTDVINDCGFQLNGKKTKLMTSENRKVVTGINVTSEKLSLTRNFKRELRKEEFFISKYGLRGHLDKKKVRDPLYIDRLIGKANYWCAVESWNPEAAEILLSLKEKKRLL